MRLALLALTLTLLGCAQRPILKEDNSAKTVQTPTPYGPDGGRPAEWTNQ